MNQNKNAIPIYVIQNPQVLQSNPTPTQVIQVVQLPPTSTNNTKLQYESITPKNITPNTSFHQTPTTGSSGQITPAKASLKQFAQLVLQKVKSKKVTSYNEVADELVAEYGVKPDEGSNTTPHSHHFNQNPQPSENKNIRRRVYDALNVLMALKLGDLK